MSTATNGSSNSVKTPDPAQDDPVVIIGMSLKFPQDAVSVESFWKMLMEGRSASSEVPKDRYNVDAFYAPGKSKTGMVNVKAGHFIRDDLAAFDAPFFTMTPGEVACMDPLQRWLLETSYQGLENAGIPMEEAKGSKTSVYIGSFLDEYGMVLNRDLQMSQKYKAPGTAVSMLANRLSWFYDLRGPSIALDTACSSSLVAFHLACQSLVTGESEMSIVGGCNLTYNPETSICLSDLGFLSPDGISYSFDERANGYARGEGFGIVILKSLSKAVRDGNTIRAVVRATGSNQDGRTPGITQPSMKAQETLIRETYQAAGLDMGKTAFVEAHATGTTLGDPIEAAALGNAFKTSRETISHLHVGAVKSNIGHLEGASGVAGLIKTVLALERATIPPNVWPRNLNKRIQAETLKLKFPTKPIPWPTSDLRRASVNSFGFGGANAHVVLDDAFHYLRDHDLIGNHLTAVVLPAADSIAGGKPIVNTEDTGNNIANLATPKLFVFSAPDEDGLRRVTSTYQSQLLSHCTAEYISDLAYTLSEKRMKFRCRYSTAASSIDQLKRNLAEQQDFVQSKQTPRICFVFTGQGAQWYAMGRELLRYPEFRRSLEDSASIFADLGCQWSLVEELLKDETTTNIALVQQLSVWSISPSVVVGHSSGEIAAAYCTGALSVGSACKVAYFRGFVAAILERSATPGSMLAVGMSEDEANAFLNKLQLEDGQVTVACINSPKSITLSASKSSIDMLQVLFEKENIFVRRLPVHVAYHSPQMDEIAELYRKLISELDSGLPVSDDLVMFSSLTGSKISNEETSRPKYWVDNMISPVKFSQALGNLGNQAAKKLRKSLKPDKLPPPVNYFLEIGPHSTLKGAIKATMDSLSKQDTITYMPTLVRGKSAVETAAEALGNLWCRGHEVNLCLFNDSEVPSRQRNMLVDLPCYPFDHSRKFWLESRLSKGLRFRQHAPLPVLGTAVADWNPLEPRWRNIITLAENPWIKDHNVNGADIYPAAGMLVMAMEGAQQMSDTKSIIKGYHMKDVSIKKALVFPTLDNGLEVQLYFRPGRERTGSFLNWSGFRICVYEDKEWSDICTGSIAIEYQSGASSFTDGRGVELAMSNYQEECREMAERCRSPIEPRIFYSHLKDFGLNFGPTFRSLTNLRFNDHGDSLGTTDIHHWQSSYGQDDSKSPIMHPAALDTFLQLACLGLTKGGKETLPTMIPTTFRSLWISADIANQKETSLMSLDNSIASSVRIYTKSKLQGFRDAHSTVIGQDAESQAIVLVGDVNFTGIAELEARSQSVAPQKLCYKVEWKPDLDLMERDDVYSFCSSGIEFCPPYADMDHEKSLLCHFGLRQLVEDVQKFNGQMLEIKPHLQKYLHWAEHRLSTDQWTTQMQDEVSRMPLSELLEKVAHNDPQGKLMVNVLNNLNRIMKREVDALEVIFQEGLVNEYYHFTYDITSGFDEALRFIDTLAHKSPRMRILEIGAGTGSATGRVLRALTRKDNKDSAEKTYLFQDYTFTDISTSFFEAAKIKFSEYAEVIEFRILDIEKDPADQMFDIAEYDLIVASNVIHATASLNATLQNVRKLMKPGGKFVLFELTVPDNIVEGVIFGLLPGWWLSTEEHRQWGPMVTRETWNSYLKSAGFTGLDLAFPAHDETAKCHTMISTASEAFELIFNIPKVVILTLGNSALQNKAAERLQYLLKDFCGVAEIKSTVDVESSYDEQSICVPFLELEHSFLDQISQDDFNLLKLLFSKFGTIIWASSEISSTANPLGDMITGLARCVREENGTTKLVTVKLSRIQDVARAMTQIFKVIQKTSQSLLDKCEVEFAEIDGSLCISRIAEFKELDEFVSRKTTRQQAQMQKFREGESTPMKLAIGQLGLLSTLQYEADSSILSGSLAPDEIEIEVKAAGLNFRDVLIALGQDPASYLGIECSGVVIQVGEEAAAKFKIGARVCCVTEGCLRTNVRCDHRIAIEIPDHMPFQSGAAFPVAYSSAYYSVTSIARLRPNESILIHSGAGAFGQACIQLAKLQNANIFTTVGTDEKKEFLVKTYGIEESNIFSSRSPDFAQGVKALTNGRGVDVIINSLAGEALKCTWDCIAPFGRFVEVGKKDIYNFGNLPMFPFSRNVTFSSVDIFYIYRNFRQILTELMESGMALFSHGKITVPSPIEVYHGSEVETAFRYLESGKSKGKLVIEFHNDDIVPVVSSSGPPYNLDPNSTYVIAGGLGGLGRSIARWMVTRSAKHLILLSRSKLHSEAVVAFLADLRDQGIDVATPPCDVGDRDSLESALQQCAHMPPIRGCVQASMVLKDAMFANMTVSDFQTGTKAKVDGSWNLHTLLPLGMDFFILLSSLAGLIGSRGQSNYAAGNTYQDGLAHYRNKEGEKALSLDLGKLTRIGYVAEREGIENDAIGEVQENALLAMMEYACNPDLPIKLGSPSQVVTGIETPAALKAQGVEEPYWMLRPMFSPLYRTSNLQSNSTQDDTNGSETCSKRIATAETLEEATEIIIDGLQTKLSRTLAVQKANIDTTKPMHIYGVDSLSAVELRTWFRNVVGVDITVFDILGNQSLADLAATVAPRSQFLAEELKRMKEG
ncbi:reducing type I polyketide synthase [Mollisia scopiformis]|uniref:Reducing type I polyketide synthase n=1 Tax=Mollisia scopiformis TaxID=149040 RepID=A0A132BE82_MOLSC|nr:reducing type I polyketide synthase [Mollisia scopiformis]KUJ10154.1 reducing type I polyketide synthase [Mollisia scopiformis]